MLVLLTIKIFNSIYPLIDSKFNPSRENIGLTLISTTLECRAKSCLPWYLRFDRYRGPSSFNPERLNLLNTSFLNIRYCYTFVHYL